MSAKASYQQAETDVAMLTGIRVSAKTQERMVKRATLPSAVSHESVTELALDGGMGEYAPQRANRVSGDSIGMAWFKSPPALLAWVTTLPIASLLYALGDGHCGIWSLFEQMSIPGSIDEILDWFHLKENLYKVVATDIQLEAVSSLLWEGRIGAAKERLDEITDDSAKRFSGYLERHTGRIPNYRYYPMEGLPIGSGPVESLVKQIDARLQLAGAQWNTESLPQVLKLRCAYLNEQLDVISSARE